MNLVEYLRTQKPIIWQKLCSLLQRRPPAPPELPRTPQEALELGFRLGLQTGYGEGFVDGVDLGTGAEFNLAGSSRPN